MQCVNSYRNKDFQCKPISDSKFNLSTFFSTLQVPLYFSAVRLEFHCIETTVSTHRNSSLYTLILEYLHMDTILRLRYCAPCQAKNKTFLLGKVLYLYTRILRNVLFISDVPLLHTLMHATNPSHVCTDFGTCMYRSHHMCAISIGDLCAKVPMR